MQNGLNLYRAFQTWEWINCPNKLVNHVDFVPMPWNIKPGRTSGLKSQRANNLHLYSTQVAFDQILHFIEGNGFSHRSSAPQKTVRTPGEYRGELGGLRGGVGLGQLDTQTLEDQSDVPALSGEADEVNHLHGSETQQTDRGFLERTLFSISTVYIYIYRCIYYSIHRTIKIRIKN